MRQFDCTEPPYPTGPRERRKRGFWGKRGSGGADCRIGGSEPPPNARSRGHLALLFLGLSRDRLTVALGSPSETRPAWCPYAEILTQPTSRTSPARRAGPAVFDISAVASRLPSTETRLRRNIDRPNLTETRDNAGFPGRVDISVEEVVAEYISAARYLQVLITKTLAIQAETRSP